MLLLYYFVLKQLLELDGQTQHVLHKKQNGLSQHQKLLSKLPPISEIEIEVHKYGESSK